MAAIRTLTLYSGRKVALRSLADEDVFEIDAWITTAINRGELKADEGHPALQRAMLLLSRAAVEPALRMANRPEGATEPPGEFLSDLAWDEIAILVSVVLGEILDRQLAATSPAPLVGETGS